MTDETRPTPETPEPPDTAGDAYLWDLSAPVDAEVAALERTLQPLRLRAGFASVQQATGARRLVMVRRVGLAVAAMLVVGTAFWWAWPSLPRIRNIGPWQVVSAKGARLERDVLKSRPGGGFPVVIKARHEAVELRTPAGSIAQFGAGTVSSVNEGDGSIVFGGNEHGKLSLACGSGEPRELSVDDRVVCPPGGALTIDSGQVVVLAGEARIEYTTSKSGTRLVQRLAAGMQLNTKDGLDFPRCDDAPARMRSAYAEFEKASSNEDSKVQTSALRTVLDAARPRDAGSLWNIAFASHPSLRQDHRESVVNRLGELLGRWPAAAKSSKEPPWSQTFAEDWWEIVKSSAASSAGDAKSKQDEQDALKKKDAEAAKEAAEKAAKEKRDLEKKSPPVRKGGEPDPKSGEPVKKEPQKGKGK